MVDIPYREGGFLSQSKDLLFSYYIFAVGFICLRYLQHSLAEAIMMPIHLPTEFSESYLIFQKYPRCIVSSAAYGPALWGLRDRLNRKKTALFTENSSDVVIPVREIQQNAQGRFEISKRNLLSEEKLKEWLGDTYERDTKNPAKFVGALATRPDPQCRFM